MMNAEQRREYFAKHPFYRFLVYVISTAIGIGVAVFVYQLL